MTKDLTGQRFGRLVVLDRIPPGELPLGNMERTATQPTAEQGGGAMKKFVPYPHQQAGIDWILSRPACALFWSMGTG